MSDLCWRPKALLVRELRQRACASKPRVPAGAPLLCANMENRKGIERKTRELLADLGNQFPRGLETPQKNEAATRHRTSPAAFAAIEEEAPSQVASAYQQTTWKPSRPSEGAPATWKNQASLPQAAGASKEPARTKSIGCEKVANGTPTRVLFVKVPCVVWPQLSLSSPEEYLISTSCSEALNGRMPSGAGRRGMSPRKYV